MRSGSRGFSAPKVPGLTDDALAGSDVRIRIPMATGVDSVNVGTAAAIAFRY